MTRTTLLATSALWVLAAAPTFADGAGGKMLTGLGDIGYSMTTYDGGEGDIDTDTFHFGGAALWSFNNNWNFQGDFGFNSDRFDFGGEEAAIDTWRVGGTGFWRDQNQGLIGGEVWYQSLDFSSQYVDGFGAAARGEWYASKQLTLGARAGFSGYDRLGFELDEWSLSGFGKYYVQPDLGLTLGANYTNWDGGEGGESDADDWYLYGEAEYQIPDCTTSVYAGLTYGNLEFDESGDEIDYWGIGAGLRVRFGTTDSLNQRQRSGPLERFGGARFVF